MHYLSTSTYLVFGWARRPSHPACHRRLIGARIITREGRHRTKINTVVSENRHKKIGRD